MSDATNSNKRDLWLYDDGSWREGFHDDGKVSPLLHYIATPADDAVARARDRVVEAAKVYVRNSRTGRNCADEYYTTHREEDEESIHDAVDALLAAERDAKGGERG